MCQVRTWRLTCHTNSLLCPRVTDMPSPQPPPPATSARCFLPQTLAQSFELGGYSTHMLMVRNSFTLRLKGEFLKLFDPQAPLPS